MSWSFAASSPHLCSSFLEWIFICTFRPLFYLNFFFQFSVVLQFGVWLNFIRLCCCCLLSSFISLVMGFFRVYLFTCPKGALFQWTNLMEPKLKEAYENLKKSNAFMKKSNAFHFVVLEFFFKLYFWYSHNIARV